MTQRIRAKERLRMADELNDAFMAEINSLCKSRPRGSWPERNAFAAAIQIAYDVADGTREI